MDIKELQMSLRHFAAERDWQWPGHIGPEGPRVGYARRVASAVETLKKIATANSSELILASWPAAVTAIDGAIRLPAIGCTALAASPSATQL